MEYRVSPFSTNTEGNHDEELDVPRPMILRSSMISPCA